MSMSAFTRIHFQSLVVFAILFVAFSFTGCSKGSKEDREFEGIASSFIEDYFKAHPVSATWVGEHKYDGMIDALSDSARASELASLKSYLVRLKALDKTKLSLDNRVDDEILTNEVNREIFDLAELKNWQRNPLFYTRLLGNSIYMLIAREFAPADKRLDSAISRLKEFPRVVDEAMKNLSNPPRIHTETAIKQNRGTIALCNGDLRRFASQVPGKEKEFEEALKVGIDALNRFQTYLEKELYFQSNGDFRLGEELFRKKLSLTLQSNMQPEEIVDRAKDAVDRLHNEMFELALPLYKEDHPGEVFDESSMEAKERGIKTVLDDISRDHPKPEDLLAACREAYREAENFVREKDLIDLPDEPLEIIWAPEYSRGVAVAGLRSPGPLDKGMKSFYVVSPVPEEWTPKQVESYLREYNNYMIRVLTIHEAMPGHYVQLAYANRCPSLVRAVFSSGSFVEGWAVYTERMMLEEGFHGGDPKLWLQRKKFYLRAVINSILDTGIHMQGMSEYQAMKLMVEDGFQEESEASGKWRRACLTSTQLSTYFIGYNEVLDLRKEAKEKWGSSFQLKKFHEELLAHGSPPAKYLEAFIFGD
ncbi:DUF885 domain-containing protein [bacterium]|nr:MAG: DUF885 domain-containing protein [bacterium]